jgi:hypothetical protein
VRNDGEGEIQQIGEYNLEGIVHPAKEVSAEGDLRTIHGTAKDHLEAGRLRFE